MAEQFDFSSYHVLLLAIGASVINSYWLPRFFPGWEPAASALILLSGAVAFLFLPAMPAPLDPLAQPGLWESISELTVIVALFGTGLRIDTKLSFERMTPTMRLLLVAMPITIFAVAAGAWWLAGMTIAGGIVLGAILAPTDPVLAGDLHVGPPQEGDEHPVQHTLTTEAGLNDGLAFPFIYLGILLASSELTPVNAALEWIVRDLLYRITAGVAGGAIVGWVLGKIVFAVPRHNALAEGGAGVIALSGVLLAYSATELAEGYGFVAAFVAGSTLRSIEPAHPYHQKLHNFSEAIEHGLTALILFMLGGAAAHLLAALTWQLAAVGALLIFVIRPAAGWIALAGTDLSGPSRSIAAFYGVRGIGSVYYIAYVTGHVKFTDEAQLWAATTFVIILSTVAHGLTAGLVVKFLQRKRTEG